MSVVYVMTTDDVLSHHGIRGMHWGDRNYQYTDGSLTPLGRIHYGIGKARDKFSGEVQPSLLKTARSSLGSLASKSDKAANVLDYMNRKGTLDFLNSKCDQPFSAIKTASNERAKDFIVNSAKSPLSFLSNLDRYMDMSRQTSDRKSSLFDFQSGMKAYDKDASILKKGLDAASKQFSYEEWGKALLDSVGGSSADKKLGMLSKDARDIERASAGKEFLDTLKSSRNLPSKLSSAWYNTDNFGRRPAFTGQVYETKIGKMAKEWTWEPVYNLDGRKIGEQRKTTKWEEVPVADISKPTKEFLDYNKSFVMPSNYSHLGKEFSKTYSSNVNSILDRYKKYAL